MKQKYMISTKTNKVYDVEERKVSTLVLILLVTLEWLEINKYYMVIPYIQ